MKKQTQVSLFLDKQSFFFFLILCIEITDSKKNDMIQPQTLLNVADNSGARELMCIRIIGAGNHRYAHIGDVIVAVIKEAVPNMPLERSEVIIALIVRTHKELKRDNGMIIRYDDNAAVVINRRMKSKRNSRSDRSGIERVEFH
jgi:large subunit ribosomal protein L14